MMRKDIMGKFFKENKIFLAIIIAGLVVAGAVYFSNQNKEPVNEKETSDVSEKSCQNIPDLPDLSSKLVTKVIDGDTFIIEGGYSVRILGIDADERDHPCYQAAKDRLEELILNKDVKLEKSTEDKDQWCRYLRYVFLNDENISLELVKEGLAVARSSPEDVKYREEIIKAEKEAKENKTGCKWSPLSQEEESKIPEDLSWEKLTDKLTGLKIIGACQAGNYLGKEMIIEGKIVDGYRSKTNTVFLNFEKSYPNQCFTGVIFSSDQYKFVGSPEKYYQGKRVRIRGKIKNYQGRPEVILEDPSQIEIGK